MGRGSATPDDPLLVSVRSGAKFSMPGMMETVLNIGLNDASVHGLAEAGRQRAVRLGLLPPADPDVRQDRAAASTASTSRTSSTRPRRPRAPTNDLDLDAADLQALVETVQGRRPRARRPRLPAGPARADGPGRPGRLRLLERRPRAILYRRQERIPADLGTAVNVLAMVFGNLGMDSGTGVAFTRDPASGAQGIYGDYLQNAQGEDVVAGIRNTVPLHDLERHRQAGVRPAAWRSWPRWRTTTGTCATSSSPSSAASSGCCRPGSASAPPRPRSHRGAARRRGPDRRRRGAAAGSPARSWPS